MKGGAGGGEEPRRVGWGEAGGTGSGGRGGGGGRISSECLLIATSHNR